MVRADYAKSETGGQEMADLIVRIAIIAGLAGAFVGYAALLFAAPAPVIGLSALLLWVLGMLQTV